MKRKRQTKPRRTLNVLHLIMTIGIVSVAGSAASGQCYGGPCEQKAHQPGQVTWYDNVLSNAGWGEGPPCSSCHTTRRMVEASKERASVSKNFPQRLEAMPEQMLQQFHQQAVRIIRGRGPLQTLPEHQVEPEARRAYEWIKESAKPPVDKDDKGDKGDKDKKGARPFRR